MRDALALIFRIMGWLLVVALFAAGAISVLLIGVFTLPLGILFWLIGAVGWFALLTVFIELRRKWFAHRRRRFEEWEKVRAMNPHIWPSEDKEEIDE
ncbi:MAG TPA: hypothetical protein VN285_06830 [Candidatus Deferrimicrobium sp.]|nr:hypothetical protein [Candidatus Deferrimicrobium sp.]